MTVTGRVIRVYDATGNVIETHEHKGDFKECEVLPDSIHPRTRKSPFPVLQAQSAFHRRAPRNAFLRGARQRSRSFAPENQRLGPSPNSNRPGRRSRHVRVSRCSIDFARNFREALAESQEVSCLDDMAGKGLKPVYKLRKVSSTSTSRSIMPKGLSSLPR